MFGYIKPFQDDLKVRELRLYKACYCGLCRAMGVFSRLSLNYDMVFLALVRAALTGEQLERKTFRCWLKPWQKREYIKANAALAYSASVSGILAYYKCIDDARDSKNKLKKLAFRVASLFFLPAKRRACAGEPGLGENISLALDSLGKLERAKCASVDEAAEPFARLMQTAACFGLDINVRIAEQIGWHLGRWLYIIDAADDFERDLKKREYNPFVEHYGGKAGFARDLDIIRASLTSSLDYINAAFSLLPSSPASPVIFNIINIGLCDAQEKILRKYKS